MQARDNKTGVGVLRPDRGRLSRPFALATALVALVVALSAGTMAMPLGSMPAGADPAPPVFNILLGRPTDQSVTANIIPDQDGEAYIEYGTSSGAYSEQTGAFACVTNDPVEVVIDGLSADTDYYYRLQFKATGSSEWAAGGEYSFNTQRAPGEAFTFTIIADSHQGQYGGNTPDQNALYRQTLLNAEQAGPDFHIDLGDTFAMDPSPLGTGMTDAEAKAAYLVQRPYMGLISHSVPIFLVLGNHENEEGWNFDDVFTAPDQSLALAGMKYRKLYYPNPIPDGFYTGNEDPLPTPVGGDTFHEDYYAWTWGDALFVVLDPYHYSMTWPSEGGTYGGEGTDGETGGDRWDWTLGYEQYQWFKDTLENSDATYKFVFSHHVTGGDNPYGRGGMEAAPYFEWGGLNWDGTPGFAANRPGWEAPIHQVMVDNGVTAFFHGHDHAYAYEVLDGIVYQECPKPDEAVPPQTSYLVESAANGGDHYPDAATLPASGHIRVSVSPSEVSVQYVKSYLAGQGTNGEIAASYVIPANQVTHDLTMAVSPSAGGTTTPAVGEHSYAEGTVVSIAAAPTTGYVFDSWTGPVADSGDPTTTVTMDGEKAVTAIFTLKTYTLTYTAGANGSITGTSPQTVDHGGSGTSVTAVPNTGYHFVQWSDGSAANPRTDTNVMANISVTAQFAINTYTLTYSAGTGGTLSGSTSQTVSYGGSGTAVTVIPNTGYHFVQWSNGSTANPRTDVNVTANITVTAQFALDTFTLTYSAGTGGTITGSASQSVSYGGSGTAVTAVPNAGYHFVEWSDGVTTATRTDTNVTANKSVTAQFAINTYTLTYTPGAGGTISGVASQTVDHGASGTSVTAVPATGYHFVQWSDGSTSNPRTDTNVTASNSVTASFAIDTFALSYSAGANGSISGAASQTVSYGGSGTAVTATPDTGYHFVTWSDGLATATRQDVGVTADLTVIAGFALNTYTLTYEAGTGGSLTGTTSQTIPHGGNGSTVTAVPATGYRFVQWSDGSTANPRTDTSVTSNVTVTANFVLADVVFNSLRGSHRYQTAQLVSQAMFAGALPAGAGAVVAPGETYQEALCGAPLAAAYGGPVLLTPTVGLENGTKAELQRLGPTYVFVIGLSTTVLNAVKTALPAATVVAINGANVYDMSYQVAKALGNKMGLMTEATAIVTIGTNFADAIGVSPLACAKKWPILLTDKADNSALHTKAAQALSELSITKMLKVGTYAPTPVGVTGVGNLSGADRYVTNANVATWAKVNAGLSFAHTGIATGDKFPDALASGPYLAKDNGILLLSPLAGPLPPVISATLASEAVHVYRLTFIAMIEPVISQVNVLLP